jgi:outer membrane lipopolysaccharide assembly protein LptE/RlpB
MKKFILLFAVCLSVFKCGYHLRGTGSSLPPHIKVINIPMFANQTTRFELDLKLTQEVIDEMVARGKVEITGEADTADAILIGEIVAFRASPIAFGEDATADRYSITVVAKVVLRDVAQKKVLYSNPSFIYQGEYEVPEGSDFESVETEALNEIAEKFARSLVVAILEGF